MKHTLVALVLAGSILVVGCKKDDTVSTQTVVNNSGPVGATTTLRSGTLAAENATPTAGSVSIIRDANNDEWLSLGSNFTSSFATGTVVVYLAKTNARIGTQRTLPPPPAPNVIAVGFTGKNGAQTLKIAGSSSGFPYVVLYCETAEINFGNALLN